MSYNNYSNYKGFTSCEQCGESIFCPYENIDAFCKRCGAVCKPLKSEEETKRSMTEEDLDREIFDTLELMLRN
jgi:hypothetical protein